MIPNFFNTPNVPIPALFKAPEPILSTARNVPIPALFTALYLTHLSLLQST